MTSAPAVREAVRRCCVPPNAPRQHRLGPWRARRAVAPMRSDSCADANRKECTLKLDRRITRVVLALVGIGVVVAVVIAANPDFDASWEALP